MIIQYPQSVFGIVVLSGLLQLVHAVPGFSFTCQMPTFYLWDTDITFDMWNMKGRSCDCISWVLFPKLSVFNIARLILGAVVLLPASAA